MDHLNIIMHHSFSTFALKDKEMVCFGTDSPEVKGKTFTFDGFYHKCRVFYPKTDKIAFINPNYIGYPGISIGKIYLIEKLRHSASGRFQIEIGICNDFGEHKFYPPGAFRFLDNEF